jgi:hypothetical protein
MKLKKKDIFILLGSIIVWVVLLLIFDKIDKDTDVSRRDNFAHYSYMYLSETDEFVENYGKIITLEAIDEKLIECVEDKEHPNPYRYMRFTCQTEKATLVVYVEFMLVAASVGGKWGGWKYAVEKEMWK